MNKSSSSGALSRLTAGSTAWVAMEKVVRGGEATRKRRTWQQRRKCSAL